MFFGYRLLFNVELSLLSITFLYFHNSQLLLYSYCEAVCSLQSKKVYKAVECDKHAKAKQSKTSVGATISMISRAEDNLDQVEFSTLSIDVGEALKAFEEKYNKEDR